MVPAHRFILLVLLVSSAARADGSATWGEVPKTKQEYITIEEPPLRPLEQRTPASEKSLKPFGGKLPRETLRPLDVEPPQPSSPTKLSPGSDAAFSDVADLLKHNRQEQTVYNGLNASNPPNGQFDIHATNEKLAHALGMSASTLERVTGSRKLAALSQYVEDPNVMTDWHRIVESPIRSLWIWVQMGWVFAFWLLRRWRLALAKGLGRQIFERIWLNTAFFVATMVVIPWTLFGSPYYRMVTGVVSILFS